MRIRIPRKKVRERFLIVYELEGAQRATDFLCKFYRVRRMRVILDGKRVGTRKGNGWLACYSQNKAYFTNRGLNKRTVLHEFYHHLVEIKGLELPERIEEKQANSYSSEFVKKSCVKKP
jgi:hypothetical protein